MKRALFAGAILAAGLVSAAGAANALPAVRVAMPADRRRFTGLLRAAKGFFRSRVDGRDSADQRRRVGGSRGRGWNRDIGPSEFELAGRRVRARLTVRCESRGANTYNAKTHQSELVVAANSTVRDTKDLNGKIVAVSGLKNVQEVGFDKWMDSNGGDWKSVHVVEVPFSATAEAVASGRVDAAMMAEPELGTALAGKRVKILSAPFESIGQGIRARNVVHDLRLCQGASRRGQGLTPSDGDGAEWANHNQDESGQILAASTGIPVGANASRLLFATAASIRKAMQALIERFGEIRCAENHVPRHPTAGRAIA